MLNYTFVSSLDLVKLNTLLAGLYNAIKIFNEYLRRYFILIFLIKYLHKYFISQIKIAYKLEKT